MYQHQAGQGAHKLWISAKKYPKRIQPPWQIWQERWPAMAKRQVSNPRPSQFCGLPSCAVHGGLRHPVELEIQLNYLLFFVVLPKLFRTTWRCSETRIAFYHSPLPKRTCHEISAKFRLLVSLAAATSMPKSPACWSLVCVEIPGMMVKNSGTQCKSSEVQPPWVGILEFAM